MSKKLLLSLCVVALSAMTLFAQAPEMLNYQGVARNNLGNVLTSQSIGLQVKIHSGSESGTVVYQETHSGSTNAFGLFNIQIGSGTVQSGTFSSIEWGSNSFFAEVLMDDLGGTNYTSMGTQQLVSVPYALYAKSSANAGGTLNYVSKFTPDGMTLGNSQIFDNGTSIGIGTTSPNSRLHISGTGLWSSFISLQHTTEWGVGVSGNSFMIVKKSGSTFTPFTLQSTGDVDFKNSLGTQTVKILDNGNVGIGTTTPEKDLHIRQSSSNKGLRLENNTSTDYWENGVGVSTHNYKFYFNDLLRADISSVDGAYTQASDRRLKEDIQYMDNMLGKVMELKPATYKYIDNHNGGPRSIGFIAQEVEQLFPDLVREGENGYKGLVYDGFAVISIKAIQEQQQQIESLKVNIKQLQEEIITLKAK